MIVVTGGEGFIGQNLVRELKQQGNVVIILDIKNESLDSIYEWLVIHSKDIDCIYKSRKEFSDDILVEAELSEEESVTREHEKGYLKHYCNEIGWVLEDMRITLIPRVLQLSDDEEANLALLRFEAFSREFLEDKRKMWLFSDSDIFNSVIQLLDESGRLYEILQRKMPQKRDLAYRFREPTPFL